MAEDEATDQPGQTDPPADAGADAADALEGAQRAMDEISSEADAAAAPAPDQPEDAAAEDTSAFDLAEFVAGGDGKLPENIDLLSDVKLDVKVELGRTTMLVEDVLRLADGCVVELDKLAGDPVDIYVNNRHIARGEVLVLNDNFCIRINEILSQAFGEPAANTKAHPLPAEAPAPAPTPDPPQAPEAPSNAA